MANAPASDPVVGQYVGQLQRRYPQFQRDHRDELRGIGSDFAGRFIHEYLLFRNKNAYEASLQTMLTPEEHDRLHRDAQFTRAWQIFVDLCWLRKRLTHYGIAVGVMLLGLGGVVFLVWAIANTAGKR